MIWTSVDIRVWFMFVILGQELTRFFLGNKGGETNEEWGV